jgi:hypothetical protein
MNTPHYVCTGGCRGASEKAGICQAPRCLKHGLPLTKCDCADGQHTLILPPCEHCGKLCSKDGTCEIEAYKEELPA